MIQDMPTPAIIVWGPEFIQSYNHGYTAIMGALHPQYFGARSADCWPDTFPAIEPILRQVLAGGVATFNDTHFAVTRYGFAEEAYFSLAFSPIRDDDGRIAGIFQPIVKVTPNVLANRRAATLHELAQMPGAAEAIAVLSSSVKDGPFTMISLWNDAESALEIAAASAERYGYDGTAFHRAAREAFDRGECLRVDDFGFAPVGPWGDPTSSAFVVPLRQSMRGVAIFGISPNLHFDDAYRRFLESAAATFDVAAGRAALIARADRARSEVNVQKERLAALFMQAPAPVCVLRGPEHVIEIVNPAMRAIWGRPHAEVIERPLFEALPDLADQVFKGLLDDVLRTGQSCVGKELAATF